MSHFTLSINRDHQHWSSDFRTPLLYKTISDVLRIVKINTNSVCRNILVDSAVITFGTVDGQSLGRSVPLRTLSNE